MTHFCPEQVQHTRPMVECVTEELLELAAITGSGISQEDGHRLRVLTIAIKLFVLLIAMA